MNLEITGKLIEKFDALQVSERFRKREFVLEISEEINGNTITNFAKMQLVQNKCEIIDRFNIGDMLKVNFNIKGNRWERDGKINYITNLDAWRIEVAGADNNNQGGYNTNNRQQTNGGYSNTNSNYANGNQTTDFSNGNQGNFGAKQGADINFNPSPETTDDLPF